MVFHKYQARMFSTHHPKKKISNRQTEWCDPFSVFFFFFSLESVNKCPVWCNGYFLWNVQKGRVTLVHDVRLETTVIIIIIITETCLFPNETFLFKFKFKKKKTSIILDEVPLPLLVCYWVGARWWLSGGCILTIPGLCVWIFALVYKDEKLTSLDEKYKTNLKKGKKKEQLKKTKHYD